MTDPLIVPSLSLDDAGNSKSSRPPQAAQKAAAEKMTPTDPIEWQIDDRPVDYLGAVAQMEARVAAIRSGKARELVWLLSHPALYTAGTSTRTEDLIAPHDLPVFRSGRGGQYTYHGPGQRIAYVLLDLGRRGRDIRHFVTGLEAWMIAALARFNIKGERRLGRVGIWVDRGGGREDKIGAVGVRIRHWVSFHGLSLNVDPDLRHYRGIVPCGIRQDGRYGVTSLTDLGIAVGSAEVDSALIETFPPIFGGAMAPLSKTAANL